MRWSPCTEWHWLIWRDFAVNGGGFAGAKGLGLGLRIRLASAVLELAM